MKSYDIYNFDHGCRLPTTIESDSFRIIIKEKHCSNLKKIPRNASTNFTINEEFKPVIIENEAIEGTFSPTAIVELKEDIDSPSHLFPPELNLHYIDDINLILSFLTGRRVYLQNEINKYSKKSYIAGVVSNNRFPFSQIQKKHIVAIAQMNLHRQFINIVTSYSIEDMLSLTAYCNSTIDTITNRWAKENGKTKFDERKLIAKIITKSQEVTLNSICTKIQISFLRFLKSSKCKQDVIEDIEARIHISNNPSALFKLKSFLQYHDLYPSEDTKEQAEKLKWLNTVRNSIAHRGDLPKDKGISYLKRVEITANISLIMLRVIQWYYITIVLQIDDPRVRETQRNVKNYFITGKFYGHDIFNETYREYMGRLKDDWTDRFNM